jgi:FkbM family methyltransferase
MRKIILFINPTNATCGVYQHGKLVAQLLENSKDYAVVYKECSSINQLVEFYNTIHPDIIIYNYHPSLLGFLVQNYNAIRALYNVQHVGLITDGTQEVLLNKSIHDNLTPGGSVGTAFCPPIFDRYLFMDPETVETAYIKKVLPTIPLYKEVHKAVNKKVTIGSFGFGGTDKGFNKLVEKVEEEFDEAIIRVHIPFATYGDSDGANAKARVEECKAVITKPGIELVATHDFLPESEILDYLHDCDINIFVYNDAQNAQGVASTPHFGIAVNKPFLVSNTSKTRHLIGISDLVDMNKTTIKKALVSGKNLVKPFRDAWSRENALRSYEKVFNGLIDLEHYYGASTPPLDSIIASAFPKDGYKGVCIDIGAGDGKLGSNTLYFERNGWDCLCIEPNPIYTEYLQACRKNVVTAAVTSNTEASTMPLKVVKVNTVGVHDGDPPHQYGALTSLQTDEKLYQRFKQQGLILEEYEVSTKVMTLTNCIEENSFPTKIDFISIDTEGTELDVIKSIDFNKIQVSMFVVENNFKTTEIEDYLQPLGYIKYLTHEENDFYIHNSNM